MKLAAIIFSFYSHPLVIALRVLGIVVLLFLCFQALLQQSLLRYPIFFVSVLSLWEIFFYFHLERKLSKQTIRSIGEIPTLDQIAAVCTLKTQAILLGNNPTRSFRTLLKNDSVRFFLKRAGILLSEVSFSELSLEVWLRSSFDIAKKENAPYITPLFLFAGFLASTESKTKLLFSKALKEEDFLHIIHWARKNYIDEEIQKKNRIIFWGRGIGNEWVTGWSLETKKYTQDFTQKALTEFSVLVGREKEFGELLQILSRKKEQNALLVGLPGVGVTTLVEAFAVQSFLGTLPGGLSHKRVLELSVGSLLAGVQDQGVLEGRIKDIAEELEHAGDIILYIPQIEHVLGAGGFGFNATGALLPLLQGSKVQVIGAATPGAYKNSIEPQMEFASVFEKIAINEPDSGTAIRVLEELAVGFEKKHNVVITFDAIKAAVILSSRYLPDRFLPGKAIHLLDDVCSGAGLTKKSLVNHLDIQQYIEEKTNVPIGEPKAEEQQKLLHLEEFLHQRVIGQNEAVQTLSQAMRRLRTGVVSEKKPVGVFLFLGPTGVGKTELARALTATYFGSEQKMIRIDMGAYKDSASLHRLIGNPDSDGGGELTEKARANPFSLILLDEFEKADKSIIDVFLSIFEEGRADDAKGRPISFTNTIIIVTSNAGAELIREKVQLGVGLQSLKPQLLDTLQKEGVFKPELLNRFDAIVLFEPLKDENLQQVVKLALAKLTARVKDQDIALVFDDRVVGKIAKNGSDPQYGARPLHRYIQDTIEDMLSKKMLKNEVERGDTVIFSTDEAEAVSIQVKHQQTQPTALSA